MSYGEYHCHNNRGSAQPIDPIHSTYGAGGTGYTTPAPDYAYPSYKATPSCPFMSSYDSLSGSCKCYSGYVVGKDILGEEACVSADSKCTDLLGYGGRYDSLSNKCECRYGYLYNGDECVSETIYCVDQIGLMSRYNSLSEKCECLSGYEFNGSSCVTKKTETQSCQDTYGMNSYSPISGKCGCLAGYEWATDNKSCVRSISCYGDDVKVGNKCITLDESCQNSYGANAVGVIGSKKLDNTVDCKCKNGYEWNSSKTSCLIIKVPTVVTPAVKKVVQLKEIENNAPFTAKIKDVSQQTEDKKVIQTVEEEQKLEVKFSEPIKKRSWFWNLIFLGF